MNLSTLLTLIDDDDPVVEEQLCQYYLNKVTTEKIIEFESIQHNISSTRLPFYTNLHRSIKMSWFNQNLNSTIENPSIENISGIESVLLSMNVFFPKLHSVNKSKLDITILTNEIRESILTLTDPTDKLTQIGQILFFNHQFGGNSKSYYDILNSDFSHVIESKRGIPISLSMLTFIISRNLKIPCIPANIPRHFMLYFPSEQPIYMDCFNSGNLLSPEDLADFLKYLHIEKPITDYHEENFLVILKRWFQNMAYIYSIQQDDESTAKIQSSVDLINQNLPSALDV